MSNSKMDTNTNAQTGGAGYGDQDDEDSFVIPGIPNDCAGQVRVAADLCARNDYLSCASTLRAIADVMKNGRAGPPAQFAGASDDHIRTLTNLLLDVSGLLAPLVEDGKTVRVKNARDVLYKVYAMQRALQREQSQEGVAAKPAAYIARTELERMNASNSEHANATVYKHPWLAGPIPLYAGSPKKPQPAPSPVARLHVRLEDDGLVADVEVLDGTHLQVTDSPIDVYLTPAQD